MLKKQDERLVELDPSQLDTVVGGASLVLFGNSEGGLYKVTGSIWHGNSNGPDNYNIHYPPGYTPP